MNSKKVFIKIQNNKLSKKEFKTYIFQNILIYKFDFVDRLAELNRKLPIEKREAISSFITGAFIELETELREQETKLNDGEQVKHIIHEDPIYEVIIRRLYKGFRFKLFTNQSYRIHCDSNKLQNCVEDEVFRTLYRSKYLRS